MKNTKNNHPRLVYVSFALGDESVAEEFINHMTRSAISSAAARCPMSDEFVGILNAEDQFAHTQILTREETFNQIASYKV